MPIELLVPFENQPFLPYTPEKLERLAADISANGILSPVIVRPVIGGKYQILAGHNRTQAAKTAGLTAVPCIVKDCDERAANLIMVNTNLNQRDELLPSEKAYAYKIQKECSNVKEIAAEKDINRRQIQRYIRLTYLDKRLLDMVDCGMITFVAGVNLSYLSEANQQKLCNFINIHEYKITPKISERLKTYSFEDFDDSFLFSIFKPMPKSQRNERKKDTSKPDSCKNENNAEPEQSTVQKSEPVVFSADELQKFFPNITGCNNLRQAVLDFLDEYC